MANATDLKSVNHKGFAGSSPAPGIKIFDPVNADDALLTYIELLESQLDYLALFLPAYQRLRLTDKLNTCNDIWKALYKN